MAEKRSSERRPARLKVRFWRTGEPERVYNGYTSNVSSSGCYVQTDQPIGTAGRLQMEIIGEEHGFVCEGVVARSLKAPYELRQVKPSGMGIRFLPVGELLRAVVPNVLDDGKSATEALTHRDADHEYLDTEAGAEASLESDSGSHSRSDPEVTATVTDSGRVEFDSKSDASKRAARMHPAAAPRKAPEPYPAPPPAASPGPAEKRTVLSPARPKLSPRSKAPDLAFRIAPPSLERLAALYHSELLHDHLFIPTQKPSEPGATVRVQLVLPESNGAVASKSVDLYGVVQKQWLPNSSGSAPGQPAGLHGLGLQLEPSTSAKKTIGSLVASIDHKTDTERN